MSAFVPKADIRYFRSLECVGLKLCNRADFISADRYEDKECRDRH